jgi:glutaredoxin-related protein
MGQAASKAKEAVSRAANRGSKAIQAQRTRAAAEAEWKKQSGGGGEYSGGEYSPTRGHNQIIDNNANEKMPEMPPDLIKFLNDAGPLKRTVDKELTSAKVYDALVTDEKTREEHTKQANLRVRRRMPIVSYKDHDDLIKNDERRNNNKIRGVADDDVDDGTMTTRTTNFSTRDRSTNAVEFGLDRMEMFRLALKLKEFKVNSTQWKEEVEKEFQQIRRKKILSSKGDMKDFGQLKDFALFENSMRYIGVPVLMKDEENDIIGVKSERVEDLRFTGLKEVPEEKFIFVMKAEEKKEANSSTIQ